MTPQIASHEIAAALQWDRGRWIWLLVILLAMDAVLGLGDNVNQLLRYDRGAIAAGGWWRLLTAHIVHLDVHHLILNELGLGAGVVVVRAGLRCGGVVRHRAAPGRSAISCGLWWLSPRVGWYVGASGVLHSVMAAGVARSTWRSGPGIAGCWLVGLCAKLAWEQWGGHAGALDRRRCASVRCGVRIYRRGCTLLRIAIIRHRSRA